ncbi:MAG TPA: AAA family ATPase, partial [Polyangiaceae bacterium]|nr:AAA family ATPase [Polyangiaceae bacterium]
MRLLKLRLIAYGPFTDAEIDLAANGVHIVYGKNEAGKSTALRAITGLLYGIAKNTPDAHLHKMPDLRVGGTFLTEGGKGSISLTRRKGREHTLLDQGGRPVDEVVLSRLLGGVSQEQFLTSFGLDHESLRKGGNALLLGEGAGENLFSAALSGGEVHQILRGLRAEADALFTAKAHTKPLNEALRAFADATKAVREAAMSPDALLQQRELLDDLGRERAACEADRQRLMVERAKLVRAEQALPVLAKHQLLGERRRAMGDVVLLPPSARSNRALHLRTVSETTQETARLNARLADLATRRDRLVVPEGLVRYKEVPLDLANRLGSHRKAARDLPRLHGEIEELEAEALTVLRKLGREVTLEKAEAWRVDAAALGSIRRVAKEKAKLAEEHRQNQRALAEKRSRMALLVAKRDQVGSLPDAGALRKAVTRAEREGPLDDRLAKLEAHVNLLQQDAESELGSLGQRHSSPEAAAALPVPLPETIERFARQWATREADALRVIGESTEQEALLARLAREIKALELAGRVPTEPALIAAREQRDRTWKVLRGSEGLPSAETFDQFERQLREADELSDRLRREAERVSRLAVLLAERDSAALRKAALTREQERLERERLDEQAAWRAAWSGTGVDPRPPAEMKPWVQRHAKLVRTADELRRARSEAASLRAVIAMHALPIRDMLEAAGGALPPSPGLGALLDHAGEVLEKMARAVQEKRETERLLEELTLETAELAAGEKRRAEEAERLAPTWDAAARSLGLSGSASPDEATDAIDWLAEAFRKIDQIAAAGRRAAGIERDGKAFAEDVARLVAE